MLSKADCPIDWTRTAEEIHNQVRGLSPWPTATTTLDGTTFKIHETRKTDSKTGEKPGAIRIEKDRLFVATGDSGEIEITELQSQNARRMTVRDYLLGHTLKGVFE